MEDGEATVGSELVARIKDAASYTSGDQSPPCAILWTDPERLVGTDVLGDLKPVLPELFVYGTYSAGRAYRAGGVAEMCRGSRRGHETVEG